MSGFRPGQLLAGAGLLYIVTALDLLPDLRSPPGSYVDDLVVATFVLNVMLNCISQDLVDEHSEGRKDLLRSLRAVLTLADELGGKKFAHQIRAEVDRSSFR